jgi:hypothetical protein
MNSTGSSARPIVITARMPDLVTLAITAVVLIGITGVPSSAAPPTTDVLHAPMEHLRSGQQREWSDFPQSSRGGTITVPFTATANASEYTLALRQKDVADKRWAVALNGKRLGSLVEDERGLVAFFPVLAGSLQTGKNELRISATTTAPRSDDILVGDVRLIHKPVAQVLSETRFSVEIVDRTSRRRIPARVSIADQQGFLVPIGAASTNTLAVRTGAIYTSNGVADFSLPEGTYTIYASRGFEYGIDSFHVSSKAGEQVRRMLQIDREVPVPGYIGCDTHIHTLELSGHGDASVAERLINIAGEGVELAVATEHNKHADYSALQHTMGLDAYFTTVPGNEVTTGLGHYCVFPVRPADPPPNWRNKDWPSLLASIRALAGVKAIILNHPRDLHEGFRPFASSRYLPSVAEDLDGREFGANAMELVNAAAMYSDPMRLYRDWFGLLNRGLQVAGVGSTDTHWVDYVPVGQSRTYIEAADLLPGAIDPNAAADSLTKGRTLVSYGLVTTMTVNGAAPGHQISLQPSDRTVNLSISVYGPSWTAVDSVVLFANGTPLRQARVTRSNKAGLKWRQTWQIPKPEHDVYLVAVATGPGVVAPYWAQRKPYQPVSQSWVPRVIGSTGAVRIDADGDGHWTSSYGYALAFTRQAGTNVGKLFELIRGYDQAVAAHAANLLRKSGIDPAGPEVKPYLSTAGEPIKRGFAAFIAEWHAATASPGKPR